MPARRQCGGSSYRLLDPVGLPLLSQPHSTALPSPKRYGNRYEDGSMGQGSELRRMPKRRSSQNFSSPTLGEKGPVGREEGVSVPDRIIASIVHGRPAGALIGICILMYAPIPPICT